VLYAAYHVLLTRYTRQNDICVGVPLSNRTHPGSEAVVGLFLNTVVLRPRADDDPAFRELVARVRAEFLDAVDHGDLPFSRLVEELQPERDLSRNPVFQAMFTMAVTEPEPRLARLRVERLRLPARASFMDISAEVRAGGSEAEVSLCADADLFAPSTSAAMAADFERILAAVAQDPDIPLSCAPAPSAAAWLRESPSAAVPDPVAAPGTAAPSPAEAGARQVAAAAVTEVWSRILATPVRGHEDFFELGGTSLLAIRIVSDLRARSIGPVTVRDVFETRTADGLAARLAGRRASEPAPPGPTRLPRHRRALDVPGPDSPQGVK
ncbi:condensation domain-containing protein, partial [Streptomyces sp. NPDC001348]